MHFLENYKINKGHLNEILRYRKKIAFVLLFLPLVNNINNTYLILKLQISKKKIKIIHNHSIYDILNFLK